MAGLSLQQFRQQYPQYNDLPDEKLVPAMHQRFYPDMPYDKFTDQIGHSTPRGVGDAALGAAETVGSGITNILPSVINAVSDLVHRIGGNASSGPLVPSVHNGEAGERLAHGFTGTPHVSTEELRAYQGAGDEKLTDDQLRAKYERTFENTSLADEALPQQGTVAGDLTRGALKVGGDVAALAPVTGLVKGAVGKFATAETGLLRSGGGQGIARTVAGDTGKKALQSHNQQVGNAMLAGEANHVGEAPLSYEATEAARQGPSDVYTRIGANLPEGALDEAATSGVNAAGSGTKLVTASETAQNQIAKIKTQLAGQSFTGNQLVDNMRSLRQEGFKRIGSNDVDQQAIGHAQLDMARAVEGHVERNLPQGGDVTVQDFRDARKALAKNHAVESALHGPDVDLKAIARMQRADPQLLDGGMKEVADFANGPGRDVVGLPDAYNAPSFAGDVADAIDIHHPIKGVAKFLGGARARAALTGDTAAAVDAARARYAPAPGRFDPRPGLTPPPGRAGRDPVQQSLGDLPQGPGPAPFTLGEGANPNPPAPAGPPGQMSLADLLSHGVEQGPSPGLSAGPMGAPAPQGLPFARDAAHEAGGLGLAPEDSWFKGGAAPLGDDLAKVMSQGVPEGTAARAPQRRFVGDTVDFPSGTPRRQIVENNASGESAASVEAQRRLAGERSTGSAPFMIDPGGSPQALAHTVDAVDVKAPKGHLKVQKDPSTGKLSIVDRGGLSLQAARGLLNRYLSLHGTKLGDAFGS
jgi:hypothetical protein